MELLDWSLGFARHLFLVGILLFVAAILFFGLGRKIGLPLLFWHERRSKQLLAGFAVALLVSEVLFVAALLDVGQLDDSPTMSQALGAVGDYVLRGWRAITIVTSIGLLIAAALKRGLPAARLTPAMKVGLTSTADDGGARVPRWPLPLGVALGWGVAVLVAHGAAGLVNAILDPEGGGRFRSVIRVVIVPAGTAAGAEPLHLLAALIFSLLFLYFVTNAFFRRGLGATPAVAVCTLLALIASLAGFLAFRRVNPLLIAGGLLAAIVVAGLNRHKLRFPCFDDRSYRSRAPAAYTTPGPGALLDPRAVWERKGGRGPMVLVCASGGGLRAAVWTVAVLCELEAALEDFTRRIQLVAGASGGMLGAGHFVTSLRAADGSPAGADGSLHVLSHERLIASTAQDGLSELAKALIFRDIPLSFLPVVNPYDRGRTVEAAWRRQMGPSFARTFGQLRAAEAAGQLPSLVYSPMLVEDGRRVLMSNLDLEPISVNMSLGLGGPEQASRCAYQMAGLLPDAADIPISTAARMSASFPYVMPAATLPLSARRRVVDAGYYDNYGVNLISAWLYDELQRDGGAWLQEKVPGVVVIQIRDEPLSLAASDGALAPDFRSAFGRGLEGITTPPEGLLAARDSVMLFRNDEQLEALSVIADQRIRPNFLRNVTFSFRGEASLSWYLTAQERNSLVAEAKRLRTSVEGQQLFAWWNDRRHVAAVPDRARLATRSH